MKPRRIKWLEVGGGIEDSVRSSRHCMLECGMLNCLVHSWSWNSSRESVVVRRPSRLCPRLKLGAHLVLSVHVLSAKCEFNLMAGSGLVVV